MGRFARELFRPWVVSPIIMIIIIIIIIVVVDDIAIVDDADAGR